MGAFPTLSTGLPIYETAANLSAVQRLFSMFPDGAAGVALVLLRLSVAATLITSVLPNGDPNVHAWEFAGLGLLGGALCFGVFTPVVSVLACFVEIASLSNVKEFGVAHLVSSILITSSLAMLGPELIPLMHACLGGGSWSRPRTTRTTIDQVGGQQGVRTECILHYSLVLYPPKGYPSKGTIWAFVDKGCSLS